MGIKASLFFDFNDIFRVNPAFEYKSATYKNPIEKNGVIIILDTAFVTSSTNVIKELASLYIGIFLNMNYLEQF